MSDLIPDPNGPRPEPAGSEPESRNRRPIRLRDNALIRRLARRLAAGEVTPNEISMSSMGCAAIALLVFWAAGLSGPLVQTAGLVLAALLIQARLLCNLLDGMVAVEGGKGSASGAFWNEAPDRIADLLFFWGAGLFAGLPALGLGIGALAICSAWLRELGRAEGFPPDFSGPMAKPQRMAALTLAALAAAVLPLAYSGAQIMGFALWLILAGLIATLIRRSMKLLARLEARGP